MERTTTEKIKLSEDEVKEAVVYWLTNHKDIRNVGDISQVHLEDNEAEVTIYANIN